MLQLALRRSMFPLLLLCFPFLLRAEHADADTDQGHRFFEQRAFRAGRFWVGDEDSVKASPSGSLPIIIESDRGQRVFGSEGHHTTILGLQFLQQTIKEGDTVIDYGTGTGIQAIGALRLGAESALAVDIDHEAVDLAERNAGHNGVGERLEARLAQNIDGTEGPFDVCIANILPGVLINMASHLALYVKPGGTIGLTGLKKRDIRNVKAAFAKDFEFEHEHLELGADAHLPEWSTKWGDQKDWVLLKATRTSRKVDHAHMSAHAHGERSEVQILTIRNAVIALVLLLIMTFVPRMGKLKES